MERVDCRATFLGEGERGGRKCGCTEGGKGKGGTEMMEYNTMLDIKKERKRERGKKTH